RVPPSPCGAGRSADFGDLRRSRARVQTRGDASSSRRAWTEDREPRRGPFPPPRRTSWVASIRANAGAMLRAGRAPRILSVSELAQLLRSALDTGVGTVWVAGEISNLKRPASGHLYFTLKDDRPQLGAVMFRSAAQGRGF